MIAARSREQLQYRETCYEIVAYLPTGPLRLGFTNRPNKHTILQMAREHADAILPHVPDDAPVTYSAARGWQFGPVRIGKSGRTEWDCAGDAR